VVYCIYLLTAAQSVLIIDTMLLVIIGGDVEAVATAAGPVGDVRHGAQPRGGVTNTRQPKLTSFVSNY